MLKRLALAAVTVAAVAAPAPSRAAEPLPGGGPVLLPGAALGAPAPEERREVLLVLALRDGVDELIARQQDPASPDFHRWLTPARFAERFSPTSGAVDRVRRWAAGRGLQVGEVPANRTLVPLTGTTTQLQRAFGTRLVQAHLGTATWTTPAEPASLPGAVREVTKGVLGLSTLPTVSRSVTPSVAPYRPLPAGYRPADFTKIYSLPTASTGANQTAAVITQGDLTQVLKDQATFATRNKVRRVPITVVQTTAVSKDRSGQAEYDLDTQAVNGFAPGLVRMYAYNAAELGDIRPLNRFVTERKALTASASYGGCESVNASAGLVAADDQVFRQAVAQGQTFWFSSGDDGSSCSLTRNNGQQARITDVNYPASSPYVVAVGGTTLTGSDVQPTREVTWTGSGGGTSKVERAPSWQRSNGEYVRQTGRGVPDVSLDADPRSGFVVVVSGRELVIGGTSASAPAWNGLWARVLQRHRPGFAAPSLYALSGALVDITQGSNGAFTAQEGYDLTTGLGTPTGSVVVSRVR